MTLATRPTTRIIVNVAYQSSVLDENLVLKVHKKVDVFFCRVYDSESELNIFNHKQKCLTFVIG